MKNSSILNIFTSKKQNNQPSNQELYLQQKSSSVNSKKSSSLNSIKQKQVYNKIGQIDLSDIQNSPPLAWCSSRSISSSSKKQKNHKSEKSQRRSYSQMSKSQKSDHQIPIKRIKNCIIVSKPNKQQNLNLQKPQTYLFSYQGQNQNLISTSPTSIKMYHKEIQQSESQVDSRKIIHKQNIINPSKTIKKLKKKEKKPHMTSKKQYIKNKSIDKQLWEKKQLRLKYLVCIINLSDVLGSNQSMYLQKAYILMHSFFSRSVPHYRLSYGQIQRYHQQMHRQSNKNIISLIESVKIGLDIGDLDLHKESENFFRYVPQAKILLTEYFGKNLQINIQDEHQLCKQLQNELIKPDQWRKYDYLRYIVYIKQNKIKFERNCNQQSLLRKCCQFVFKNCNIKQLYKKFYMKHDSMLGYHKTIDKVYQHYMKMFKFQDQQIISFLQSLHQKNKLQSLLTKTKQSPFQKLNNLLHFQIIQKHNFIIQLDNSVICCQKFQFTVLNDNLNINSKTKCYDILVKCYFAEILQNEIQFQNIQENKQLQQQSLQLEYINFAKNQQSQLEKNQKNFLFHQEQIVKNNIQDMILEKQDQKYYFQQKIQKRKEGIVDIQSHDSYQQNQILEQCAQFQKVKQQFDYNLVNDSGDSFQLQEDQSENFDFNEIKFKQQQQKSQSNANQASQQQYKSQQYLQCIFSRNKNSQPNLAFNYQKGFPSLSQKLLDQVKQRFKKKLLTYKIIKKIKVAKFEEQNKKQKQKIGWSYEQNKSLLSAVILNIHSFHLDKKTQRSTYDIVAEFVNTRSTTECQNRFSYICKFFKQFKNINQVIAKAIEHWKISHKDLQQEIIRQYNIYQDDIKNQIQVIKNRIYFKKRQNQNESVDSLIIKQIDKRLFIIDMRSNSNVSGDNDQSWKIKIRQKRQRQSKYIKQFLSLEQQNELKRKGMKSKFIKKMGNKLFKNKDEKKSYVLAKRYHKLMLKKFVQSQTIIEKLIKQNKEQNYSQIKIIKQKLNSLSKKIVEQNKQILLLINVKQY